VHSLIENAVRFSPRGGTIRLEVEKGEVVKIIVRDEGPGVVPEERERVSSLSIDRRTSRVQMVRERD